MNPPATSPAGARVEEGPFDLVVFDWDGTLIDSTGAISDAIRRSAADLGLRIPSFAQASEVIGLGLHEALRRAVPDLTEEKMAVFVERYRFHYLKKGQQLFPFEGMVELLDELSGRHQWLAVATGKSRVGLNRSLEELGWHRRFITTRCADEGRSKPDPWMLLDIGQELGVAPERMVMIGDTTHDLGMAQQAGVTAVGVTYGAHPASQLEAFGAAAVVGSVAELRHWLLARIRPVP